MNLNDVLREKILKEYKSNKSNTMFITMKKRNENENENKLVNAICELKNIKLTFVKKILSESKKKKNNEILVMSKTSCSIDHDDLLMNIEIFES